MFGEEATEKVLCGSAQCMIGECLVMGQVGHVLGNVSESGSGDPGMGSMQPFSRERIHTLTGRERDLPWRPILPAQNTNVHTATLYQILLVAFGPC